MKKTLLLIGLCSSLFAQAPAAKQTPPPPGPLRPFQFPKYETKKLDNGLTVFVITDRREPLASFNLVTPAGSTATEAKQAGMAAMTASLLRQGTKSRSAQEIAKLVDGAGGHLGASASLDTASVSGTFTKSTAAMGFELMAEIVRSPAFDDKEIERIRKQTLSSLQVAYNDPEALAGFLAPRVVLGRHPYAYPQSGTPETVRNLKREDIVKFHGEHYSPAGSFLAIAGDVSAAEAFGWAEKYFGSWKAPDHKTADLSAPAPTQRRVVILDKPDAVQTQFSIGQQGVARNDPDYIPLLLGNQIFGGSFNSRLNMKLRAAEGLTYGAGSNFSAFRQAGSFRASSFTRTEKTAVAIGMMMDLLKELVSQPITDKELSEAKAYSAGSFVISVETAEQVADRVISAAVNKLPADYWNTYREKIQAVTKEQVEAALKRHLSPDKMAIVAVGNAAQFSKELSGYGPLQVIPATELDVIAPDLRRAKEAGPVASSENKARGLALAQAAAAAMGGKDKLTAIRSLSSKSSFKVTSPMGEMKGDGEEAILYPDKVRTEMTLPMGKMVQAFDGKSGWMQLGANVRDLPASVAKDMRLAITASAGVGLLVSAVDGKAEILAGDAAEQVVWKSGESTVKLLFDPATKRVAKISYRGSGMQGPTDIDVLLSDYRDVGGVQLPFSEVTFQNGQKFAERTFVERKLNPDIAPEKFQKP